MNKYNAVLLLGVVALCLCRTPTKPRHGALPYLVYFSSRYRGLCVGTLAARGVVLTAAVCITSPETEEHDYRPITVVVGASYRHQRRGVRVPVQKILLPNLAKITGKRAYLMQKSVAVLLLKHKVPDILVEIPLRAINIDWRGQEQLALHEECFMPGWHFFYKGDKIFPVHKFLLQRYLRVQFLNVVKTNTWCEALSIKFQKALSSLGFTGLIERTDGVCVKDAEGVAQPCHGMYGAPLICRARAVGMLMAPDAQWTNCTGMSNIVHLFNSAYLEKFMKCVSSLFDPEPIQQWSTMKRQVFDDTENYDYVPAVYDHLVLSSSESD